MTQIMKKSREQVIAEAAALLAAGALVALPTETVYGLAADAANSKAVANIYAVKGRPQFNPLIIHVADAAMAAQYVEISPPARQLMEAFWPGPLSLVLPIKAGANLSPLVSAGLSTVAVRCPQGIFADIIRAVGRPLAAPSANISGKISPTNAQAVEAAIGDKIALVVDGGACKVGVESTIIQPESERLIMLRAGGTAAEDIAKAIGRPVEARIGEAAINAPGQLKSHYAPEAKMRLNAREVQPGEALLAFGRCRAKGVENACAIRNLSEKGDLAEAAANLFTYMAELDRLAGLDGCIAAEPVPMRGLGAAINDRLARAAADRDS